MGTDDGTGSGKTIQALLGGDLAASSVWTDYADLEFLTLSALGVSAKLLEPDPDLPTVEELVEVLLEHPELCAEVKRILDEDHEQRTELRRKARLLQFGMSGNAHGWGGGAKLPPRTQTGRFSSARVDLDMIDAQRYAAVGFSVPHNKALKLWEMYDQQCELYDRTVCTGGLGPGGGILPTTGEERRLINENAHAELARVRRRAAGMGIDPPTLEQARKCRARERQHDLWLAKLNARTRTS